MLSLMHLVLLLLIPTIMLRSWVLFSGARKFVKIFEGRKNAVQGGKLVETLEIPGLKSFVRYEILLGTLPYFILIIMVLQNQYVSLNVSDLSLTLSLFTAMIFAIWLIFDLVKSLAIYRELSKLAEDTNRLKKITGSALDGLRFIVHSKGIIRRTAVKFSAGLLKKRLEKQQKEKKSFFRKVSISSLSAVEKITSFPERVSKKLTQWVKEDLDERLVKRFEKYSNKSLSSILLSLIWSLIPAIWVVGLNYLA
tara:strand:+ start:1164 stop:1919 length:756 start_codon:yes stop_codon:yes gene_type:complete